ETARAVIVAELDQRTDPVGVATDMVAELTRGPIAQKDEVKPAAFQLGPLPFQLKGKKGTFPLELPASAWGKLPPREFKNGTLEFRVPWQSEPVATEVVVRKLPYRLSITPDVARLDLSAHSAKQVTKTLEVALQTRLATAEPVWLSATDEP